MNCLNFLSKNNENNRGIVVISISLDKQDIKQCGNQTNHNSSYSASDPFYNTDKCDRQTTDVNYMKLFTIKNIF